MGLKDIFEPKANFTELAKNIQITFNEIPHKAAIEVDEKGANDANYVNSRLPQAPLATFYCDRPFLFTVNNRDSSEVLLFGAYRGPDSQKRTSSKPDTVSLDQFTVFNELGAGSNALFSYFSLKFHFFPISIFSQYTKKHNFFLIGRKWSCLLSKEERRSR